jgi:hypothetical protein
MEKDTTIILLFRGWNLQDRTAQKKLSSKTRRHWPDEGFHSRDVPSTDAETMKSFATDQSKSVKKSPKLHYCNVIRNFNAYLMV